MAISTNKNALTSIGLKVGIAIEATAGTKPTTNYYPIEQVTDLPDLDFEPDTIETTSYKNLEYKSYLPGLKDTGGIISLPANYTQYGVEMWDDIVDKLSPTNNATGKIAWLLVSIQGTTRKWFVPIKPVTTGLPSAPVNDKVSINYNFTVAGDIDTQTIADDSTYWSNSDYTNV